jgi:hypothetical protein
VTSPVAAKIDAAVALMMAVGPRAMVQGEEAKGLGGFHKSHL